MTPYQVAVAGEAYAATLFSQAGYDVALQYGTTQPNWDIIATKNGRTMHVSVKSSQDGGWGLFQNYKRGNSYPGAVQAWLALQPADIVFLFLQFQGVTLPSPPRAYIARPAEIITHMLTTRAGHCTTTLLNNYTYQKGVGKGHSDVIPISWHVTQLRIDTL